MNNPEDIYNTSGTSTADDTDELFYREAFSSDNEDMFFQRDEENISNRLAKAKESKVNALSKINSGASLDDSFTDMGNGWLESNRNKIWNDISDQGIQSLRHNIYNKQTLTTNAEGKNFYGDGTEYTGRTRRVYLGGSKDSADDVVKLGLARGDKPSSRARYNPDGKGYGWASGKFGIDADNLDSDVLVPYDVAVMYEAVSHGRKKALEGRVVKDMFADPFGKDLYGSGASEYYKNKEALFGAPTEIDEELGARLFDEYLPKVPKDQRGDSQFKGELGYLLGSHDDIGPGNDYYERAKAITAKAAAERGTTLSSLFERASNTVSGFASMFIGSLIINPVDAIGDATGLFDLGSEEEKSKYVNDFFGYDDTRAAEAAERVGKQWDKLSDPNLSDSEKMSAIGSGLLEAFTTPELLGTSLGAMLSWFTPGVIIKGLGYGAKAAKTYKKIDRLVDAEKISKSAGRSRKVKVFMTNEGARTLLANQSGFMLSTLGNINNQYENFVANNNGTELEGADKAAWFAGRFAVQMANQNLDKFVDLKVLKAPGTIQALTTAVKSMTKKEYSGLLSTMGRGLLVTAASGGSEAAQEYIQTSLELHNSRFGSEQFKDLDTYAKFLTDPRHTREAGIAAIMGAGGSGQFELAGGILPLGSSVVNAAGEIIPGLPSFGNKTAPPSVITGEVPPTPEQVETAKGRYVELLKKVNHGVANVDDKGSTIGVLLDDIDELNATKYILGDQSAEKQAEFESIYDSTVDVLENFINSNPNLKLDSVTRKTIKQSKKDLTSAEDRASVDSTPENIQNAVIELARISSHNGENKSYAASLKVMLKKFDKNSTKESVLGDGASDRELQALEAAVSKDGTVSEDMEGTFKALRIAFHEADLSTFSKDKAETSIDSESSFKDVTEVEAGTIIEDTADAEQVSITPEKVQEITENIARIDRTLEADKKAPMKVGETKESRDQNIATLELMRQTEVAKLEKVKEKSPILGSSPSSQTTTTSTETVAPVVEEEFEDTVHDNYTRKLTAERILHVVLGSSRREGHSDKFKANMKSFAVANGANISEIYNTYGTALNYESVEDEAVRGQRGILPRLNRLKNLAESSDFNEKEFKEQLNGISKMHSAVVKSAGNLKSGISKAKSVANAMNAGKLPIKKKNDVHPVPTEYIKADGTKYILYVKKEGTEWVADVASAEVLLKSKLGYAKSIDKGLNELAVRDVENKTGLSSSIGTYTVPIKEGQNKTLQKADATSMESIVAFIKKVNKNSKGITKVILGKGTTKKWKEGGDYRKSNAFIINKTNMDENDVVLINTTELTSKDKGKSYDTNLGDKAAASLLAALKIGATIVLDNGLLAGKDGNKIVGALVRNITKAKYKYKEVAAGKGKRVFMKYNPANDDVIEKIEKEKADEEAIIESAKADKATLVKLSMSLSTGINSVTGEGLTTEEVDSLVIEIDELTAKVTKASFKDNSDNVSKFVKREISDAVEKAATEILSTSLDDISTEAGTFTDKALQSLVSKYVEEQGIKNKQAEEILQSLREVIEGEPTKKERESKFAEVLNTIGVKAKGLIESILGERSFAKGKKDIYEIVYRTRKGGVEHIVPKRKDMTSEEVEAAVKKNNSFDGHKMKSGGRTQEHTFIGIRKVAQDATKLVAASRTTVLNSVPTELLPFTIREAIETFTKAAKKALDKVGDHELAEQTDTRINGKLNVDSFNLHNSISRGIMFNKDGEVNPEVMAAAYLAIAELTVKDKTKMSRGYKSIEEVARMFSVHETEVTKGMIKMASELGSLLTTVASSVGKSMATQLGITEVKGEGIGDKEYVALIADLGNAAVVIAEEAGILSSAKKTSNELAKEYGGEKLDNEAVTHFVHIADNKIKSSSYPKYEATETVEAFVEAYKEVVKEFPEAVTGRKEVNWVKPSFEKSQKAKTKVRNDIYGKQVPERAKRTLNYLMNTAYMYPRDRIIALLAAIDEEGSTIMEELGWVPISDDDTSYDEFDSMYHRDKEVQESVNRGLEKSIEEIRLLLEKAEGLGKTETDSMYFDYFYSGNERYMLDSNTIDPQNDKLHRFLFVPRDHHLEYKVTKNDKGGLIFTTTKEAKDDLSYAARMAISQAFGKDVDKIGFLKIIEFGNAMLSMSLADIKVARKSLIRTGGFSVKVGEELYEADSTHVTHAFQALDFLESAQEALDGGDTGIMNSSLSAEFDALTSGFSNKTLQFPVLPEKDMDDHLARVGIVTTKFLERITARGILFPDPDNLDGDKIPFNPAKGHSMNDLIASDSFKDSYENLAGSVIAALAKGDTQKQNLSVGALNGEGKRSGNAVFQALIPTLPGGESIGAGNSSGKIEKSLRALFKNPFMIFNYSAGIKRIVKNLGFDVAHEVGRSLATADFEAEPMLKQVAEDLLKATALLDPADKTKTKTITTAKRLQQVLRTHSLSSIKLKSKFGLRLDNYPEDKNKVIARNLEEVISGTVSLTYGVEVEKVFTENFAEFIEVQDSMNDMFKVSFRIFDKKRVDLLTLKAKEESRVLTTEDHAEVIASLWEEFPWIVGPLTKEAGEGKDVLGIVDTASKSSSGVDNSRKKPQVMLGGSGKKSRTVTPLAKFLAEAMSSGSVLPFHALDGSEISIMLDSMDSFSIAAIHDAIIPPLDMVDDATFAYQGAKIKTNTDYSIGEALGGLVARARKTIDGDTFKDDYKDVTADGIKIGRVGRDTLPFPQAALAAASKLEDVVKNIAKKREVLFGEKNDNNEHMGGGSLEGAFVMNMAGMPGSVNKFDTTSNAKATPDISYRESFVKLYKQVDAAVQAPTEVENVSTAGISIKDVSTEETIRKEVTKQLKARSKDTAGLSSELIPPDVAIEIANDLKARLSKIGNNKKVTKNLEDAISNLESVIVTNDISKLINDDEGNSGTGEVSVREATNTLISAMNDLNGCTK